MKTIKLPNYEDLVLVSDEDLDFCMQFIFHLRGDYAARWKDRKRVYLHQEIAARAGLDTTFYISHKDGNKLNNQRSNLRSAGGILEKKPKGVYWDGKRWAVKVHVDGKLKHVGCYEDEIDAALAFNEANLYYNGPDAYLNEVSL
jgi:hypothetical protein